MDICYKYWYLLISKEFPNFLTKCYTLTESDFLKFIRKFKFFVKKLITKNWFLLSSRLINSNAFIPGKRMASRSLLENDLSRFSFAALQLQRSYTFQQCVGPPLPSLDSGTSKVLLLKSFKIGSTWKKRSKGQKMQGKFLQHN